MLDTLQLLARAGGGGSSSEGGGGGGVDFIAAIAYFPSNYYCNFIKKRFKRPLALTITIATNVIATVIIAVAGRSIIPGFFGTYFTVGICVGLWFGWYASLFDLWSKFLKKRKQADAAIAKAQQTDTSWNEEKLHAHAVDVFMRYQQDWQQRDWSNVSQYMTEKYAYHSYLMMRALREMRRINTVENITIKKIDTIDVYDSVNNNEDKFTVLIEASATDTLIDELTGQSIYVDTKPFFESWTFVRSGTTWLLDSINETATANADTADIKMQEFGTKHHFFYSLDWGKLLIPNNGQLARNVGFKGSDVNNHLIGIYDQHLVQLYSLRHVQRSRQDTSYNYTVAQLNIPKTYGSIVIKPHVSFFSFNRSSATELSVGKTAFNGQRYQKHALEWSNFNAKYDVYSTRSDALATFELLNPGFMQFLHDKSSKAIIEVVENIVYIAIPSKNTTSDFPLMLDVLNRAYKELKM